MKGTCLRHPTMMPACPYGNVKRVVRFLEPD